MQIDTDKRIMQDYVCRHSEKEAKRGTTPTFFLAKLTTDTSIRAIAAVAIRVTGDTAWHTGG